MIERVNLIRLKKSHWSLPMKKKVFGVLFLESQGKLKVKDLVHQNLPLQCLTFNRYTEALQLKHLYI
jgi:hypothetical protein